MKSKQRRFKGYWQRDKTESRSKAEFALIPLYKSNIYVNVLETGQTRCGDIVISVSTNNTDTKVSTNLYKVNSWYIDGNHTVNTDARHINSKLTINRPEYSVETMSKNYVLNTYAKFVNLPFGKKLFSWYSARRAPYFSTVSPVITDIKPNYCEVLIKKRKAVQNHIGTVHVIAICNGLEMAMGFMCEASIPKHLRWIPKGMDVKYPAKANSDIRCVAEVPADAWKPGDLPIAVKAYNADGAVVVDGTITVWVSEKR